MQRVEYQPLIVGKEPVDEPKSCHYSFQDVTFVISLVVQLCVLIFSLVTLGIGNPPPLLQLILVLETVVQGVEFLWYLTIGALYFFRKMTFGVEYRYIDWFITTPVMLITLFFLVIYFHFPCLEVAKLVDFPGSFYQHVMKAELSGFAKCTDAVDLKTDRAAGGRWWEGLGPAGRSATLSKSVTANAGSSSAKCARRNSFDAAKF